MERILKIKMKGPKEATERAEAYIEDVLSRKTSALWGKHAGRVFC